jgi:hypothetical protein
MQSHLSFNCESFFSLTQSRLSDLVLLKEFQAFRRGVPPPAVSPKESQWFIEDQAFSQSLDLAHRPPPIPPPSPVRKLDRRLTGRLRKRDNSMTTEGGGGGNGVDARKLVLYKSFNTPCFSTLIVARGDTKAFLPLSKSNIFIHMWKI